METIKLLALYWTIMIVCYLVAGKFRNKKEKFAFIDPLLTLLIVAMVFVMGLKMGANEEVISSLGIIGVQAVLVTAITVGGSMMFVTFGRKIFRLDRQGMPKDEQISQGVQVISSEQKATDSAENLKMTLLILAFVVFGMMAGYFAVPKVFHDMNVFHDLTGDLMVIGLSILLGTIGFNMGLSGQMVEMLKGVGVKAFVIPFLAVLGSLVGGALYGCLSTLTIKEGIAISAGFGWYTLAPGLITESGFVVAGAVSFLHNVLREVLGIIGIPLFAKKIGYLEATAVPGVAAMDVCMPIIEKSCRQETMIYSFITGLFMCITVPLVVPLMIS